LCLCGEANLKNASLIILKKILHTIRSHEWWEYKIPPLLAIGYATALTGSAPLYIAALWMLFLLLSVMIGAIYVSIINDITDIDEDLASGKTNRMAKILPGKRWLFTAACLLLGVVFLYFFSNDFLSSLLYILPWISFSLYSFPPARLKKRGGWGVLADASGSHIFISLLMVASVSFHIGKKVDWLWFGVVGAWSLVYGLRGILTNQFADRENDLVAEVNTFATKTTAASFRTKAIGITLIEFCLFSVMLWKIALWLPLLFLLFYFFVLYARRKIFGYDIVTVFTPHDRGFQIWMADYYQFFWPVSLLVVAVPQPWTWLILLIHIILFPGKLILYFREFTIFFKRKTQKSVL
jgi:4-hydroxybenzoate polyprenyltransferase